MGGERIRGIWRGFWGRPWLRRVTLALAAGGLALGGAAWTLRQPTFARWVSRVVDARLREETGLSFSTEGIQIELLAGRIVLHDVAIGGDLARIGRLEAVVRPLSFLGTRPHVLRLVVEEPTLRLDAGRLARIRLKPRPKDTPPEDFLLDRLEVRKGFLLVREPAWGLETASSTFEVSGLGTGPGSLRIDLKAPAMAVGVPARELRGSFEARFQMNPKLLLLQDAVLALGKSRLEAGCLFDRPAAGLEGKLRARLNLDELGHASPLAMDNLSGKLELDGTCSRRSGVFQWNATVAGTGLRPGDERLQPGSLKASLQGGQEEAILRSFRWESAQGSLGAEGRVGRRGLELAFRTEALDLDLLAEAARVPTLKGLALTAAGQVELPASAAGGWRLASASGSLAGQFTAASAPAGGLDLALEGETVEVRSLELRRPSLELQVRGRIQLDEKGLRTLERGGQPLRAAAVEGRSRTEAAQVAEVLWAWGIGLDEDRLGPDGQKRTVLVPLPMHGSSEAVAEVRWTPQEGLALTGRVDTANPGWVHARVDRLTASVSIQRDVLRVQEIELTKGPGRGSGDIWLTWGPVEPGADEMDMCFRAVDLPIEEGLRAADLADLEIKGTGGGWARLHGPYARIVLDAEGEARDAEVYGVRIPAFLGEMSMDLAHYQLHVPRFQVVDQPADLSRGEEPPGGPLALVGRLFLDVDAGRWDVALKGPLDSARLNLPGPRFQGLADVHLDGPWTSLLGPWDFPNGTASLTGGRIFLGEQSLEGLEAVLEVRPGELRATVGQGGFPGPMLEVTGFQHGLDLRWAGHLDLAARTGPTDLTAQRLTEDLIQDVDLAVGARGTWGPGGLAWTGTVERLRAAMRGFDLRLAGPGTLHGQGEDMHLDFPLEGQTALGTVAPESATPESIPLGPAAPARLNLSGTLPLVEDRPVALRAKGHADLGSVKGVLDHLLQLDPYSLLSDLKAEGEAELDLSLVGTYARPGLEGTLGLRRGGLRIQTYPQGIEDLDVTLHFQDREIQIREDAPLTGTLAQGDLRIWGGAAWASGGLERYDLQASLEDFQFRDIPVGFELTGSLDATLKGSDREGGLLKGTLSGQRAAYRADIRLMDLILSRSLGASGWTYGPDPDDPLARIALDLDLHLRDPWIFDTNLLKVQGRLGNTFKVMGTLASPGLKGKMELVPGGRITNLLPAGDVILESGSIDFTDPEVLNPVVQLRGRVDVPPYVVNLGLLGSLDQLSIVPTSTPSLRQDEVVAILIDPTAARDIGATAVSSSQTALGHGLASTSTGLLTSLALANFQEGLRKTFNLDRVNVAFRTGATGTAETTITGGKSFDLFQRRVPIVVTYRRAGEYESLTGQVEWRFGNFVFQFGASTDAGRINPAGEVRYTWSVR